MIESSSTLSHYLNFFDIFLFSVMVISILIGFVRGLTKELLSITAWGGAIVLSLRYAGPLEKLMRTFIPHDTVSVIAGRFVVFLFFLIIFLLISQWISSKVKDSLIQGPDRILGALFGFLRALGFICIFYTVMLFFVSPSTETVKDASRRPPEVIERSLSFPYVEKGAMFLLRLVPQALKDKLPPRMQGLFKKEEAVPDAKSNEKGDGIVRIQINTSKAH